MKRNQSWNLDGGEAEGEGEGEGDAAAGQASAAAAEYEILNPADVESASEQPPDSSAGQAGESEQAGGSDRRNRRAFAASGSADSVAAAADPEAANASNALVGARTGDSCVEHDQVQEVATRRSTSRSRPPARAHHVEKKNLSSKELLDAERRLLRQERKRLERERSLFEESRRRIQSEEVRILQRQDGPKILETVDAALRDDDRELREAAVVARLGLGALSNAEFADRSERELRRKVKELSELGGAVKDKLGKCWAELRIVEHDVKLEEEQNAISGLIAKELRDFKEDWRQKAKEEEKERGSGNKEGVESVPFPVYMIGDGDPVRLVKDVVDEADVREGVWGREPSLPILEEMRKFESAVPRGGADLPRFGERSPEPRTRSHLPSAVAGNSATALQLHHGGFGGNTSCDEEDDEIHFMYEKNVARLARLNRLF